MSAPAVSAITRPLSNGSGGVSDFTALRDCLACEIAELATRVDNPAVDRDWRLAFEHKRRALCLALDWLDATLRAARPGHGACSAALRDFHEYGNLLPRALVEQGFAAAGLQISGERTPWFPSARVFRQGNDRKWKRVIRHIADALVEWQGAREEVTA